jgi:hypothetical protein
MSELDQTIEELEAEVLAELEEIEEANGADAPKKGAMPAEGQKKVKGSTPGGEVEDTGAPVVDPEQKDAPAKKAVAKAKEVSGDKAQKGEGSPMKPEKLAAGDYVEPEEGQEVVVEARMTKEMMKKEMAHKMENMKAVELKAAYEGMMQPAEEMDEESQAELKKLEDAKTEIEEKIKTISVKEDVEALTEGEEFSEEFKKKAATVFEAAVKSKMRSEVERIIEAVNSEKEVEVETFKDELTEKVDTYLNYVVETWTKENELAIERGLKGEIAEDFISGLKQLFEDHYIDVPDEKYDVLEAQSEKIAELEEKINEEIQKNVDISQQNSGLVREQVIAEVSEDLADTEIEKFKSLIEDVDFVDEESFKEKLSTLKESYFPKVSTATDSTGTTFDNEDGGTALQDVDTTDSMRKYMSAISRDHKASA